MLDDSRSRSAFGIPTPSQNDQNGREIDELIGQRIIGSSPGSASASRDSATLTTWATDSRLYAAATTVHVEALIEVCMFAWKLNVNVSQQYANKTYRGCVYIWQLSYT